MTENKQQEPKQAGNISPSDVINWLDEDGNYFRNRCMELEKKIAELQEHPIESAPPKKKFKERLAEEKAKQEQEAKEESGCTLPECDCEIVHGEEGTSYAICKKKVKTSYIKQLERKLSDAKQRIAELESQNKDIAGKIWNHGFSCGLSNWPDSEKRKSTYLNSLQSTTQTNEELLAEIARQQT